MNNNSTPTQVHSAQPEHVSTLPGRRRERIRLAKKFPGVQAEVARILELDGGTSGVNHVIHKRCKSARIEKALVAEINRRIAEQASNSENPAA